MRVDIYISSNLGCCLCEDALAVVARVRTRVAFELRVVDIASDPKLVERFRYDVPVVFIDGQRAFHHRVYESSFELRLEQAASRGTSVAVPGPNDASSCKGS